MTAQELYSAVATGNLSAVQQHIDLGVDVNERAGIGGIAPLLLAAIKGEVAIARLLMDHGADPNTKSDIGEAPLMRAASYHSYELVELLLDRGAKIDERDDNGRTALMSAIGEAQPRIVELLVKRGASPEVPNRNGETALAQAQRLQTGSDYQYGETLRVLEAAIEERRLAAEAEAMRIAARDRLAARQKVLRQYRPHFKL